MARIQTPQTVQEVQAEFKIRESFGLEMLETIQPTYDVGRGKVASTGYPRKAVGLCSGAAGGVGTNLECTLICPADIGLVIVLERIIIEDIGGLLSIRMSTGVAQATVSSNPITKAFRDGRLATILPQGILAIANPLSAASNGIGVGLINVAAATTLRFDLDMVLGGGSWAGLRNSTANDALSVTFFWTEYLLEDR